MYVANFIAKFLWESGFLKGGSMEPPCAPTGVKYSGHLRVRTVAKRHMRSFMFTASFILVSGVKLP